MSIIPVDWPEEYAGAKLSDAELRAVAINLKVMNEREFTLRFTFAHELGHIICDSDQNLDKLKVGLIDPEANSRRRINQQDLPEIRANAFAAKFLVKSCQEVIQRSYSIGIKHVTNS